MSKVYKNIKLRHQKLLLFESTYTTCLCNTGFQTTSQARVFITLEARGKKGWFSNDQIKAIEANRIKSKNIHTWANF
jgi:hypothetical protein